MQLWKEFQEQSQYFRRVREDGEESTWSTLAPTYDEVVYPQNQHLDLAARLISRLPPDFTGIEIGAGPGTLTIPLANHLQQLLVIEPSPSMRQVLENRLALANLTNVSILPQKWEDVTGLRADVVIAGGCLYAFDDIAAILLKMRQTAGTMVILTHVGDDGLWEMDRQLFRRLALSPPALLPPLTLVLKVLVQLQIPVRLDLFFQKTTRSYPLSRWLQRSRELLGLWNIEQERLEKFFREYLVQEGDNLSRQEQVPVAIIEFSGDYHDLAVSREL